MTDKIHVNAWMKQRIVNLIDFTETEQLYSGDLGHPHWAEEEHWDRMFWEFLHGNYDE